MLFHRRGIPSVVATVVSVLVVMVLSTTNNLSIAFSIDPVHPARFSSTTTGLFLSSPVDGAANGGGGKPDLVDQTTFKAAIKRVEDEIEAQYRAQNIAAGTATEEASPEELQWLEERERQRQEEQEGVTLVGKLDVILPIDTQPELDLTESVGPLVLVTSCWGRTAEATGIQEFDTLTKVSVSDPQRPFAAKTKGTTLEETAGALTAAAQHALALGKTEIELEVQRLIQGYYAPQE